MLVGCMCVSICELAAAYEKTCREAKEFYPDSLREPHWRARWSENLKQWLYFDCTDIFVIVVDGNNLENTGAIGEPIGKQ